MTASFISRDEVATQFLAMMGSVTSLNAALVSETLRATSIEGSLFANISTLTANLNNEITTRTSLTTVVTSLNIIVNTISTNLTMQRNELSFAIANIGNAATTTPTELEYWIDTRTMPNESIGFTYEQANVPGVLNIYGIYIYIYIYI